MGQLALMKFDARNCDLPGTINIGAWREWADYRQVDRKKKITERAAAKQLKMLSQYDHQTQQQIIDNSIQNDYQGLFPPKNKAPAKEYSAEWLPGNIIEGQFSG